jgi:hypothetical protein
MFQPGNGIQNLGSDTFKGGDKETEFLSPEIENYFGNPTFPTKSDESYILICKQRYP